jgi:hypothetical protein
MRVVISWVMTPCSYQRFWGTWRLHLRFINENRGCTFFRNADNHGAVMILTMGWECLQTVATDWPVVHSPCDIWAWRTMVEWYRQRGTPDFFTRALWQSYYQSPIVPKQEELTKEVMNLALRSIFIRTSNIATWSPRLYFPSKGRRVTDFCHP